jgi:hypothetical protein
MHLVVSSLAEYSALVSASEIFDLEIYAAHKFPCYRNQFLVYIRTHRQKSSVLVCMTFSYKELCEDECHFAFLKVPQNI